MYAVIIHVYVPMENVRWILSWNSSGHIVLKCIVVYFGMMPQKGLTKLRISYNNSFRCLFGLLYYCSASEMFVSCDILTQPEITRKMTWGFIEKLRQCNNNVLIRDTMDSTLVLGSSLWKHFIKHCLEAAVF